MLEVEGALLTAAHPPRAGGAPQDLRCVPMLMLGKKLMLVLIMFKLILILLELEAPLQDLWRVSMLMWMMVLNKNC